MEQLLRFLNNARRFSPAQVRAYALALLDHHNLMIEWVLHGFQVAELSACLELLTPKERQRYYTAMLGCRRRDRAFQSLPR